MTEQRIATSLCILSFVMLAVAFITMGLYHYDSEIHSSHDPIVASLLLTAIIAIPKIIIFVRLFKADGRISLVLIIIWSVYVLAIPGVWGFILVYSPLTIAAAILAYRNDWGFRDRYGNYIPTPDYNDTYSSPIDHRGQVKSQYEEAYKILKKGRGIR